MHVLTVISSVANAKTFSFLKYLSISATDGPAYADRVVCAWAVQGVSILDQTAFDHLVDTVGSEGEQDVHIVDIKTHETDLEF